MAEADVSESLLSRLWQQLLDDAVRLPTLPDLALRLDALARRERLDARHLADEIRKDPAIAAQVVRMANSAAYRGGVPVSQLQAAVTRIGVEATRQLVSGLALRQLFASASVVLQSRLHAIWAESLEVAVCAQLLARQCRRLDPETGLLAGLVHRIGALPLLRLLEQHPDLTRIRRCRRCGAGQPGRPGGRAGAIELGVPGSAACSTCTKLGVRPQPSRRGRLC
ncbi:HDOD domain-containing protein [Fontimonas thermophila]|nr:HDOD domain-containing protein [Fontimonas thermophila]